MTELPADLDALAEHLAEVILDHYQNDELADCFDLREGGESYLGRLTARATLAFFNANQRVGIQAVPCDVCGNPVKPPVDDPVLCPRHEYEREHQDEMEADGADV